MATIEINKLHDYMEGYYGMAAFNSFFVTMADLVGLPKLNDYELQEHAEHGVNLIKFSVD